MITDQRALDFVNRWTTDRGKNLIGEHAAGPIARFAALSDNYARDVRTAANNNQTGRLTALANMAIANENHLNLIKALTLVSYGDTVIPEHIAKFIHGENEIIINEFIRRDAENHLDEVFHSINGYPIWGCEVEVVVRGNALKKAATKIRSIMGKSREKNGVISMLVSLCEGYKLNIETDLVTLGDARNLPFYKSNEEIYCAANEITDGGVGHVPLVRIMITA